MAQGPAQGQPAKGFQMNMGPLTAEKIKEIQECLKKGNLKIEITETDQGGGKMGAAWLYD